MPIVVNKSEFKLKEERDYGNAYQESVQLKDLITQLRKTPKYVKNEVEVINEDFVIVRILIDKEIERISTQR